MVLYVTAFLSFFAIIALPIFFLAYAIFLFQENKATRYAAVYGRAFVMILISIGIMGVYFLAPYLIGRAKMGAEVAVEGRYFEKTSGDTLIFDNGQFIVRAKRPQDAVNGNYYLTNNQVQVANLYQLGLSSLVGQSLPQAIPSRSMLTISWTDSTEFNKAARSASKKKNQNYNNNLLKYNSASFWVEADGDNVIKLTSAHSVKRKPETRYLTKL